ncbi:hypothetical protein ACP275_14G296100 [Erythranthe tilingii]
MMLGIEEILCELEMNEQGGLPPGFRFHPTDEELITFYLASKVFNGTFCGVDIAEVDLNRCEPWQLPDVAKMGEREWYFFSLRDRKYPTGLRTNRATGAGYWKATGKDREVYSSSSGGSSGGGAQLLGMKKTLVFYKGRAPRGEKTKWVMHEYRLDGDFSCRHTGKEEWVICRIIHKMGEKKSQTMLQSHQQISNNYSLPPLLEPPVIMQTLNQNDDAFTQESDHLKTLINPLLVDHLFPVNSPNPIATSSTSFANQDFTYKELSCAITKKCKKEANFESHDGFNNNNNMRWAEENGNKYYPNPFLFGSGGGGCEMGVPLTPGATVGGIDDNNVTAMDTAAIYHVMSTEPAFRWW